jgi:hypothetical protein
VKKSEQVSQINPEPAIQAAGVESTIHERIVSLDHHKPFAFQAVHRLTVVPSHWFRGRFSTAQTGTDFVARFNGDD